MVAINTSHADQVVDMSNPLLVKAEDVLFEPSPDGIFWGTDHAPETLVQVLGNDLTYAGDGTDLSGGTITSIAVDVGFNELEAGFGDLTITGTEGLNAANIDKDNPRNFWDEILKGDDTFDLSGLSAANVGGGVNTIFGDDLASKTAAFPERATDSGGDDTMLGGDNIFNMVGDVLEVSGGFVGGFPFKAVYLAGNDTMTGASSARTVTMTGDAETVRAFGTLRGGNDIINNSLNTNASSEVIGDVSFQSGGLVHGGNDILTTASVTGVKTAGDVMSFAGGVLNGGNDTITGFGASIIGGDVRFVHGTATEGVIAGGADTITGGTGGDVIGGDVFGMGSEFVTLTGGDDIIFGGAGADTLFGEVAAGFLSNVTGGNDRLNGGAGDDTLYGQTGRDRLAGDEDSDQLFGQTGNDLLGGGSGADLLFGGSGQDRLNGGTGRDRLNGAGGPDTFVFQIGTGVDRVLGFTDVNGAQDDRIDLRVFGFDNIGEIGKEAAGDDLLLHLGGGDTVRLEGYLAGNTLADLGGGDFIL